MAMDIKALKTVLAEGLPGADIHIDDLAGDGDHYAAHIVWAGFAGKNRVQQHQMVYDALQGRMGGELHALKLKTSAS